MNRKEIIQELKKYFSVNELVCNHTFAKFGEKSWQFLQTELLHTLLILRTEIINRPMHVNYAGRFQRGLRCNICQLVKDKTKLNQIYLSAHVNGAGVDFNTDEYTAEKCRQLIKGNADKLPYPIRLEKAVTWVHIDVYDDHLNEQKIVEFDG